MAQTVWYSENMEFIIEEEKTPVLFRGQNSAKIYNLVQMLIFIWPEFKMKFW